MSLRGKTMRYAVLPMVLLFAASCLADAPLSPPAALPGWSAKGVVREYDAKTLYAYIDGAADLFLAYGFQRLVTVDYVSAVREREVTVDIYDMGVPLYAFGIFASERPPDVAAVDLGNHGYAGDRLVAFWQGQWYVKVSQIAGNDPADALAFAKATALAPAPSGLPTAFARLPAEHRVRDSERYVRQSALGHKFLDDVISAEYQLGKATAELHLADLSSSDRAKVAWEKLRGFEGRTGKYLAPLPGLGEEAFVVRDPSSGLMMAVRARSSVLIAMSQTASRPAVTDLMKAGLALICAPKP